MKEKIFVYLKIFFENLIIIFFFLAAVGPLKLLISEMNRENKHLIKGRYFPKRTDWKDFKALRWARGNTETDILKR